MHFVCSRPPPPQKKKQQNFAQPLSWISHGTTVIPKRNWKQWLCKTWGGGGVNKLHYGLYEGTEWAEFT